MHKSNDLLVFLFLGSLGILAQQNLHNIQSPSYQSLIVQFDDADGLQKFDNEDFSWIISTEVVYKPYFIFKVSVNTEIKDIHAAQIEINRLHYVSLVQPNRKLERRDSIVPNDTFYPIQWNMRRIEMEKAWAITTGGPTTAGDTVVVAIIDAGFDTTHPDFGDNLWINRNEIPGDTVDNDGNGYPGDYYGWNTFADTGTIIDELENARHGMPVTGVIGAVGNNEEGIAGISWNNKFMIVVGGGDEANAIKSYGYVLTQKKLYLETNGVRGANVLVVNSSWGKNGLFASSAPIWCSLYDSMGRYGILNVSSVTNSNYDVDVFGDLPTLCPSNYLLTVTSVNSMENLGAGYSELHVDMGAPGASIYSTASLPAEGIRYKNASGTSLAAPHVSGVAGLIYSAACDSFIQYSKMYPDSAVLWVKYFLMKGIDTTHQLSPFTVSQGRLNAYKALNLLSEWCEGNLNTIPPADTTDTTSFIFPENYTLFPNPGSASFTIRGDISKIKRIEVISTTGQIVKKVSLGEIENPLDFTVDMPFSDGVYFIRAYNQNGEVLIMERWFKFQ